MQITELNDIKLAIHTIADQAGDATETRILRAIAPQIAAWAWEALEQPTSANIDDVEFKDAAHQIFKIALQAEVTRGGTIREHGVIELDNGQAAQFNLADIRPCCSDVPGTWPFCNPNC